MNGGRTMVVMVEPDQSIFYLFLRVRRRHLDIVHHMALTSFAASLPGPEAVAIVHDMVVSDLLVTWPDGMKAVKSASFYLPLSFCIALIDVGRWSLICCTSAGTSCILVHGVHGVHRWSFIVLVHLCIDDNLDMACRCQYSRAWSSIVHGNGRSHARQSKHLGLGVGSQLTSIILFIFSIFSISAGGHRRLSMPVIDRHGPPRQDGMTSCMYMHGKRYLRSGHRSPAWPDLTTWHFCTFCSISLSWS